MPSHIFAGLGMWAESNASNANALEANPRYYHSLMYLVYGHLQLGQWQEARRLVAELEAFADSPQGDRQELRGLHLTSTWLLLETHDWAAAAKAPAYSDRPLEFADTLYVRGLGSAHIGELDAAAESVRSLTSLIDNLDTANNTDLVVRAQLIRIQVRQIEAVIALANGQDDEAVALMRSAAAIEDGRGINRAPPDSGTGLPAHEAHAESAAFAARSRKVDGKGRRRGGRPRALSETARTARGGRFRHGHRGRGDGLSRRAPLVTSAAAR
jgi:hypothetical protein